MNQFVCFARGPQAAALMLIAIALALPTSADAAKSVGPPTSATYQGKAISIQKVSDNNLTCLQEASGKLTCFESLRQLESSEIAQRENAAAAGRDGAVASASKSKRKTKARIASTGPAMLIAENRYFNDYEPGWMIAGYARGTWFDLGQPQDNDATSVDGGNHSGYVAQYYQGGGGRLRINLYDEFFNLTLQPFSGGGTWNDRISSRYRN